MDLGVFGTESWVIWVIFGDFWGQISIFGSCSGEHCFGLCVFLALCASSGRVFRVVGVGDTWLGYCFHFLDWPLPQFACLLPRNPGGLRGGACQLSVSAHSWWVGLLYVRPLGCPYIGSRYGLGFHKMLGYFSQILLPCFLILLRATYSPAAVEGMMMCSV